MTDDAIQFNKFTDSENISKEPLCLQSALFFKSCQNKIFLIKNRTQHIAFT